MKKRMPKLIPQTRSRRVMAVVAILILLIAGYWLFVRDDESKTAVITAPVTRGDIEETVLASGTLKPIKLVAVGAQVSGRITKVAVKLGQSVKKGELIAQIDSVTQQNNLRTAQATLAQRRADLAERKASLTLAEQTLHRQKMMVEKKAIAQADFDTAHAQVEMVRAQIDGLSAQINQAQVAVETAQANLGYTRITAPIDGTVLAIVSQEGQTVNAVQMAPTIVVLGQLETMMIQAEISEADVVRARPGQPVHFTILGDTQRRYKASLESIEPAPAAIVNDSSINSQGNTTSATGAAIYYNGIFHVDNHEQMLRTYMTAEISIVTGQAKNVLAVPASALKRRNRNGTYMVQVQDKQGNVVQREIKVGLNNKVHAEVVSGLEEGELVVVGELSGPAAGGKPAGQPMRMGPRR